MLHHTRLGRYIYALGGNEAATRLSGINVNKIKIIVYSLCGLLASLAGIIEVARLSSAQPTAGLAMSWMLLLRWFWAVRVWRAEKVALLGR